MTAALLLAELSFASGQAELAQPSAERLVVSLSSGFECRLFFFRHPKGRDHVLADLRPVFRRFASTSWHRALVRHGLSICKDVKKSIYTSEIDGLNQTYIHLIPMNAPMSLRFPVRCDECGVRNERFHGVRALGAELCLECAELLKVAVRCGVCGDLYDAHDEDIRKVDGSMVGCWECRFCVEADCESQNGEG